MPIYVVETYLTRGQGPDRLAPEGDRARAASADLTRGGTIVRFDFAIHLTEDELCFFVFDAPWPHQAARVAQHSGLDPIRVVDAVTTERI